MADSMSSDVSKIKGAKGLRRLQQIFPLGKHYWPLFGLQNPGHGLVAIDFPKFDVVLPSIWRKQLAEFCLFREEVVPEFHLIRDICKDLKTGVIIDLGANVGVYSLLFRSVSELPIIAYEPQPFLYELVKENVTYNDYRNIDVRNIACGDSEGEIYFSAGINGSVIPDSEISYIKKTEAPSTHESSVDEKAKLQRRHDRIIRVPVTTLDKELGDVDEIALIKIDVEGFEYKVLKGGIETIKKHRPIVFLELHPTEVPKFGGSIRSIIELLEPYYEFQCWRMDHSGQRPSLIRSKNHESINRTVKFASTNEMLDAQRGPVSYAQDYMICLPRNRAPKDN